MSIVADFLISCELPKRIDDSRAGYVVMLESESPCVDQGCYSDVECAVSFPAHLHSLLKNLQEHIVRLDIHVAVNA